MQIVGQFINVYVKLVILTTSVLSKRHPHVDALLFVHSRNNYQVCIDVDMAVCVDMVMSVWIWL